MSRYVFLFFLSSLLFVSCKKKDLENLRLRSLTFEIGNISKTIPLSEINAEVSVVPLEICDSTKIGDIVRIIHQDSALYVADNLNLYHYDSKGKLQRMLKRNGNGADEYLHITDFQIDEQGNPWILSSENRCLYHYTWDGYLDHRIPLKSLAEKMYLKGDRLMFLYTGNEKNSNNRYQLVALDLTTKEVVDHYFPIDDEQQSTFLPVLGENHFGNDSDGSIYFFRMFSDTVYCVTPSNRMVPAYFLNLADRNIPSEFFDKPYKDRSDFLAHLRADSYAYGPGLFMNEGKASWITCDYNGQTLFCVRDKNKEMTSSILKDDVCLSGFPIEVTDRKIFQQKDHELIIPVCPGELLDYMNVELDGKEKEQLKQKVGNLATNQNPLLLNIKMKSTKK